MASWWQILEVEKDGLDDRAIKRAYASKLKSIRQEDDPAGFMALREAYDQGRNYLKYQNDYSEQNHNIETHVLEVVEKVRENENSYSAGETIPSKPEVISPVTASLTAVEKLMANPWGKNDVESWRDILDHERLDSIDDFTDFESEFLNYLLGIHDYYEEVPSKPKISIPVARYIFDRFGWNGKKHGSDHVAHDLNWLVKTLSSETDETVVSEPATDSQGLTVPKILFRLLVRGSILFSIYWLFFK